jgi:presenilin-like A22 family membrane protease
MYFGETGMEGKEEGSLNKYAAVLVMGSFFLIIYGLAILILHPFETAGIQPAFDNPDDPVNIVYIFAVMLFFTLIVLIIAKFWKKKLIQVIILGAIGYTAFYAFFLPAFSLLLAQTMFLVALIASLFTTVLFVLLLYKYPEWYVIDISGIVVGTSAIIIFGISLSLWLIIVMLVGLAIYDVISVYKTKHMIDLADTVMDLKLPVLLVVPKIRSYSLIRETKRLKEQIEENKEREAFFMGLGDIVMPGILVVAVYYLGGAALPVVGGTILGTLVGFTVLMRFVLSGNPQAGLPFLCGGAIAGYILTSLVFYGSLIGLNSMI